MVTFGQHQLQCRSVICELLVSKLYMESLHITYYYYLDCRACHMQIFCQYVEVIV